MDRQNVLNFIQEYKMHNAEKYGIDQIGVFGSVAREEHHDFSDIDVVVKIKTPDPYILVHIKEDLEKNLGCTVDIVRYRDKMNYSLKKNIEKEAVYV